MRWQETCCSCKAWGQHCTPTAEELKTFYNALVAADITPAVFSVLERYRDTFVPPQETRPMVLWSLYSEDSLSESLNHLLKHAKYAFSTITVSDTMARSVEIGTRGQAKFQSWFSYRAGRITRSVMRRACTTGYLKLSTSLLKQISYLERREFCTEATWWGLANEDQGLNS